MVTIKKTIDSLAETGLSDSVKVIISGAPVSAEFAAEIGADNYGANAFQAVKFVDELRQVSVNKS